MWVAVLAAAQAVAAAAAEETPARWTLSLGGSSLRVEHRELDDDGARLLVESGTLPGVLATLRRDAGRWQGTVELGLHRGAIDYDGRTQSGAPFATRTDREAWAVRVGVMRQLDAAGRHALGIGLSQHRWQRRIRGRASVGGLDERTTFWTASVDARFGLVRAAAAAVDLELRVGRSFDAEVAVDAGGRFDRATLAPGDRWHARLSLPVGIPIGARSSLVVEPGLERWRFGRSGTEPLRSDGQTIGVVYLPRSEGTNVDLRLRWQRAF